MVYDVGKNWVSSQPAAPLFWMTVVLEFPESDSDSAFQNWTYDRSFSFFGATAIKLQTDFEWDDANIGDQRGYLLERESTQALNPDSDGDGLSDGLEVKTYGTNPNDNEPWDESNLNNTNQIYGRRFEIRSFRWLDAEEV